MSTDTYRFPATHSQRALWYVSQSSPDNRAYDLVSGVQITGELREQALRTALQMVTTRHETLRSHLCEEEGQIWQRVRDSLEPSVTVKTVGNEAGAQQLLSDFVRAGFDLTKAPLFETLLIYSQQPDQRCYLAFKFHHAIVDQSAIAIISREILQAYDACAAGATPAFPENPLDYADFAVWQSEEKTRDKLEAKLERWRAWIDEPVGCINLPTDRPRPKVQSFAGKEKIVPLSATLCRAIARYSQEQATSPFVTMLTAYACVLALYARQERIVVGVPFANRLDESLENVVGLFINTLPLVVDVDWTQSFTSLSAAVAERVVQVQSAQDAPLQFVAEVVPLKRDPSYSPLFQVGFSLQESAPLFQPLGTQAVDLQLHAGGAPYDLQTWVMTEDGENFRLHIWYDCELYSEDSIDRLVANYEHFLAACIANAATQLSQQDLLTSKEKAQLAQWQGEERALEHTNLGRYVFAAERDWSGQAVIAGDEQRTHAELREQAYQVAQYLQAQGITQGQRVGLLLQRDITMLPVLLGCALQGVCYVPLDASYPKALLDYVVEDAQLNLLISHSTLAERVNIASDVPHLSVEHLWDAIGTVTSAYEPAVTTLTTPCYVIYTSGSTGMPKGVCVPHGAVINLLQSVARYPGICAADRMLALTTLSFDISVTELYLPISVGAAVVIVDTQTAKDANALAQVAVQEQISVLQASPSTWRMLMEVDFRPAGALMVWTTAEPLTSDLAKILHKRFAGSVFNLYGPTETTVWSTLAEVTDPDLICIGQPLDNTQLYVLDEYQRQVPIGVPGELYVGGAGLALGYLNREALTNERFISNPRADNARAYRTGDLVRWCASGQLEHLGRLDHQVKVRGFRVELGQIEAALNEHAAVSESIAFAKALSVADQRLIAYVALDPEQTASTSELRRHLRAAVPDYMVPQFIVVLDELPRTPNGKIDRNALPDISELDRGGFAAPADSLEQKVAEIWQRLIGVEKISRHDNFFASGGHSLLAIKALAEIEIAAGLRIPLAALTTETLAQLCQAFAPDAATLHADDDSRQDDGKLEVSAAQEPGSGQNKPSWRERLAGRWSRGDER